ncbi:unnamed protein product, partial [Didymodactylos carnosus]
MKNAFEKQQKQFDVKQQMLEKEIQNLHKQLSQFSLKKTERELADRKEKSELENHIILVKNKMDENDEKHDAVTQNLETELRALEHNQLIAMEEQNCSFKEKQHMIDRKIIENEEKYHNDLGILKIEIKHLNYKQAINFNNLSDPKIPDGYNGFNWQGIMCMEKSYATKYHYSNAGYIKGFIYGNYMSYARDLSITLVDQSSKSSFYVYSFEASSIENYSLQLTIQGFRSDIPVYTQTVTLKYAQSQIFELNWSDIDQLQFHPYDGTPI